MGEHKSARGINEADPQAGLGSLASGFVGIQISSLTEDSAQALGLPNANGALVTDVVQGSPAQTAGFKQGDVVLKMNGQAVKDNRDLSRKIAALQAGQTATFTVWRNNGQVTLSVTVAKRDSVAENTPAGAPEIKMTSLGLGMLTVTDAVRDQLALAENVSGVLITDLDPASDAAVRGLRAGDRIVAVGGEAVKSLGVVTLAIEQARSRKRPLVLLFVETPQGGKTHVPVKLEAP